MFEILCQRRIIRKHSSKSSVTGTVHKCSLKNDLPPLTCLYAFVSVGIADVGTRNQIGAVLWSTESVLPQSYNFAYFDIRRSR